MTSVPPTRIQTRTRTRTQRALPKKKEWKKEEVYTVYEMVGKVEDRYRICRIDSDQPIATLKSCDYPVCMSIFSVGTKLYLCGGVEFDDDEFPIRTCKAYMFDLNDINGIVSSIEPMNFPKHYPLLFGPVDDYKYYVFSGIYDDDTNFEMLDTNTNRWKILPIPPHFTRPSSHTPSALCGSNILILPHSSSNIYVFCTRSEAWRLINLDLFRELNPLPFCKSVPLFRGKTHCHIFLASHHKEIPRLYTSHDMPLLWSLSLDPITPFEDLVELDMRELENMSEHFKEYPEFLGGWGDMENYFSLSDNRVGFLRTQVRGFSPYQRYIIDICEFSFDLVEGTQIKVKVVNSTTHRYQLPINFTTIMPRHIFADNGTSRSGVYAVMVPTKVAKGAANPTPPPLSFVSTKLKGICNGQSRIPSSSSFT